ncbi:hypothetical protein EYZ11_013245 [Aspergillus tanneri]|uniref:Uncharacterized protein n=1 Tax=Aspergillus tanneri TaxID=1220188 RepID=A0A4S3J0C6_9EURO|nr:hypothetical protein EYZ11_013245 [Aspergillus tanneri]
MLLKNVESTLQIALKLFKNFKIYYLQCQSSKHQIFAQLEKNQKKLSKIFTMEELTPRLQRGLQRALQRQKVQNENLAMTTDTVERIRQT